MIFAYARTSTAKQAGEDKTSIAEQLAKCKAVAQLRGPIGKYDYQSYTDTVSGSTCLRDRPAGKALLEQAKKGDVIIAAKLDRLFRSAADALTMVGEFKKLKIDLILCDLGIEPVASSATSKMFFTMLAAFAELERNMINERMAEGKRAKRERGGHVGGPVPFGFSKSGAGARAILLPNRQEELHAQTARRLHSVGRTCGAVARLMAAEGMFGRDGQPYNRMAVWRMINKESRIMESAVNG